MEVNCQICGAGNRLGQIFCASCGKKLELKAVTETQISTASSSAQTIKYIKLGVTALVLIIVFFWQLGFWPRGMIGDEGTRKGADEMAAILEGILEVADKKNVENSEWTVTEKQLNGYLLGVRDRIGGAENVSLRVDMTEGAFQIRRHTKRSLGSIGLPKASIDAAGIAVGKELVLIKGSVGFRKCGQNRLRRAFWDVGSTLTEPELAVFAAVKSFTFKDGEVIISLK